MKGREIWLPKIAEIAKNPEIKSSDRMIFHFGLFSNLAMLAMLRSVPGSL